MATKSRRATRAYQSLRGGTVVRVWLFAIGWVLLRRPSAAPSMPAAFPDDVALM
jgi:hypothetical protein